MAGLETQVREILIEQRTDDLVQATSECPDYKTMTLELAEILVESMADSVVAAFGVISETEKKIELITEESTYFLDSLDENNDLFASSPLSGAVNSMSQANVATFDVLESFQSLTPQNQRLMTSQYMKRNRVLFHNSI